MFSLLYIWGDQIKPAYIERLWSWLKNSQLCDFLYNATNCLPFKALNPVVTGGEAAQQVDNTSWKIMWQLKQHCTAVAGRSRIGRTPTTSSLLWPFCPSVCNCCCCMLSILLQQPIKFCSALFVILWTDTAGRQEKRSDESLQERHYKLTLTLWSCFFSFEPEKQQSWLPHHRTRGGWGGEESLLKYGIPSLSSVLMTGTAWRGWHMVAGRNTLQCKWQRGETTTGEAERQRAEATTFFITEGTLAAFLFLWQYIFISYCTTFQKHCLAFLYHTQIKGVDKEDIVVGFKENEASKDHKCTCLYSKVIGILVEWYGERFSKNVMWNKNEWSHMGSSFVTEDPWLLLSLADLTCLYLLQTGLTPASPTGSFFVYGHECLYNNNVV